GIGRLRLYLAVGFCTTYTGCVKRISPYLVFQSSRPTSSVPACSCLLSITPPLRHPERGSITNRHVETKPSRLGSVRCLPANWQPPSGSYLTKPGHYINYRVPSEID